MNQDPDVAINEIPYLNVADPEFSVRSQEVKDARARSWCARTPYGFAILRYAEVSKLMRDPRLRQGSHAWPRLNDVEGKFADWWVAILLNREGQDHARLRRLVNPAFSPKLITFLKPRFEALANELIDGFAARGECEYMAEFSEPYATRVITILLGLPDDEWRPLARMSATMGLALGVTFKRDVKKIDAAVEGLYAYADQLIHDRRREPGDDIISRLVQANVDPDSLSDTELRDTVVLLIFGGIDTTRNQLGLAMSVFMKHPEQWQRLAADPSLAPKAVEEVMRVRPTVTWVTREATQDFSFQGVDIAKGTVLHLFSEAAGTDPLAFDDSFDIGAERQPHYGFGGGTHHCLGHFIARGDMTEALKILARRLRNPRPNGAAEWLPDSGNTGPVTLPISFDPES